VPTWRNAVSQRHHILRAFYKCGTLKQPETIKNYFLIILQVLTFPRKYKYLDHFFRSVYIEYILLAGKDMNEINIELSKKSRSIILKKLKMKKIEDVILREYKESSIENDIDREKTKIYSKRVRGSVRLRSGRFYTANEYVNKVEKVKAIDLP
jgi:hypothetical protein